MNKNNNEVDLSFVTLSKGSDVDMTKEPVMYLMKEFVDSFEEVLDSAYSRIDLGLSEISPYVLVGMGISNILVNMLTSFKEQSGNTISPGEMIGMFKSLMSAITTLVSNGIGIIEASKADESNAH